MKVKVNQLGLISDDGIIEVEGPSSEFQYPVLNGIEWFNDESKFNDLTSKLQELNNKKAVPEIVYMRQARLALLDANLLPKVEQVIAALPEPMKSEASIEWNYSTEVRRDWPTLKEITAFLNLTEEYVDDLFILAASK